MRPVLRPNVAIQIAREERFVLKSNEVSLECKGSVNIEWKPYPKMLIETEIKGETIIDNNECVLIFNSAQEEISVMIVSEIFESHTNILKLRMIPKGKSVQKCYSDMISYVEFGIINLDIFYGLYNKTLNLTGDRWQIKLSPVKKVEEFIKELKLNSGYAITYSGKIVSNGERAFEVAEVKILIEALNYFFSFAKGSWTFAILPVGYSNKKTLVWEEWGLKTVDAWRYYPTWLDKFHGNSLENLFGGFWNKWNNTEWREIIKSTIYWYILGNTQGAATDGSIILFHTAFESLAWSYCCVVEESISKEKFSKLAGHQKIRKLLNEANISLKVPEGIPNLRKVSLMNNWDGPKVFSELRNSIVHPDNSNHGVFSNKILITEGWLLGGWYLELLILFFTDYRGVYSNRLNRNLYSGDVEDVPWMCNLK